MGFVGNYAPCGLSPQTNGMPVIPQKGTYTFCKSVRPLFAFVLQYSAYCKEQWCEYQ